MNRYPNLIVNVGEFIIIHQNIFCGMENIMHRLCHTLACGIAPMFVGKVLKLEKLEQKLESFKISHGSSLS